MQTLDIGHFPSAAFYGLAEVFTGIDRLLYEKPQATPPSIQNFQSKKPALAAHSVIGLIEAPCCGGAETLKPKFNTTNSGLGWGHRAPLTLEWVLEFGEYHAHGALI